MDYLEKLKQSVGNFEKEAGKLSKIINLIEEVNSLVAEVKKEKAALVESAARIEELKKQLTTDCKTLSDFTKGEKFARRQLLEDIHTLVVKDTSQAVKNLSSPLTKIKDDLSFTSQDLSALATEEKISRKNFVDKITEVVDKNVADNVETRKKIALDLSAYIRDEKNARQALITAIHDTVADDSKKIADEISAPLLQSTIQIAEFLKAQENFQANLLIKIENLLTVRTDQLSYRIYDAKDELSRHDENFEKRFEEIELSIKNLSAKVDTISDDIVVLKNKRGILF